jgi:predicted permease
MADLFNDIRHALRQFRRRPRLALAIVVTLALALGMNVAVFSVVHAVMFRALPFASPERIVWIASVRPDNPAAPFSLPEFMDYRALTRTLSGVGAYANWSASLDVGGRTERFQGARLSANSFAIFGVRASAGRLLGESDDALGAAPVAVLSYGLWQRQFGGAADIVGRPLRIDGQSVTVVGILPRHFPLPLQGIDVIVPLVPDRDPSRFARNSTNFLRLFGRLHDGVAQEQAQGELTTICHALRQQFPREYARKESVRLIPFQEALVGDVRQSMRLLLAAVIVVLGTALANLVCLVLIRASERRTEQAVRLALGASTLDLLRQLTVEAAILAIAGSVLGWLVAAAATALTLPWMPSSIPRLDEVRLDRRVLLFALVLTGVTTLLLSLAPLAAIVRRRGGDGLRLHTRGAVGDRWDHRARQALVVGEIAIAVVLLLATALLLANVRHLQQVPPGFDADGVFQARVSVPASYRSADDVVEFYERMLERVTALPGVQHAGLISIAPLSGLLRTVPLGVLGEPPMDGRDAPSANLRVISPGYLATVGTPILEGRAFSETDRSDAPPVALVSAALADKFLAPRPIGRHIMINDNSKGPRPVEVVGVVGNVRHAALDTPPTFDVYLPLRQLHPEAVAFVTSYQFWMVKVQTDPDGFRNSFLSEVRSVDPDAAISSAGSLRRFVDASLGPGRFNLGLFAAFSLTAVLLAVSGVYTLMSHNVSQRHQEIGVRMAIGASARDVIRLIVGQAARLACLGIGAGALVAVAVRPLIAGSARSASIDPALSGAVVAMLAGVVLLASWLPARRAARIQPGLVLLDV